MGSAVNVERIASGRWNYLLLANAIDLIGAPVMILDAAERIIWCNQALCASSGFHHAELLGAPAQFIFDAAEASLSYSKLPRRADPAGAVWKRRGVVKCARSACYQAEETITAILDGAGAVSHFVSVLHDLSRSQLALNAALLRSNVDALTGVATRAHLLEALQRAIGEAARNDSLLGVLFIDLDGFKRINDLYGHLAGDAVLHAVGARLRSSIRASDTVGRYGGDEFVLVLPNLASRRVGEEIGAQLIEQLGQPYALASGIHPVGASAGLAFFPDHGSDAETVLERADAAMYGVKRQGGRALRVAAGPYRHGAGANGPAPPLAALLRIAPGRGTAARQGEPEARIQ